MAMVKSPYNGNLNPNEIFSSIYNMIISQQVMDPELADNYSELVGKYKVDGTLYGDTKLFYATDILSSRPWLGDSEASNLLNINRPADPKCQAVTLDQFRQIDITVDQYLSKRAWSTEGVFSTFNGIILGLIGQTRKLFETTLFNTYVGTTEGNATRSDVEIDLTTALTGLSGEEKARVEAQVIAEAMANLLVDMKDYSRDFNDYAFMRAYSENELVFIWNSAWINKITKLDLPTIFHKEGLMDKMDQYVLPARYFGEVVATASFATDTDHFTTSGTTSVVKTGVTDVRSLVETDIGNGTLTKHVFPGDVIPAGYIVKSATVDLGGQVYIVDADVICKIVTNDTFKFMSAFEVGTNFFNPRSLTENHYLTWGYGAPDRLLDQPLVTVHAD